jgi:4'-phosphopantetheinyl transferase
LVVATGHLVNVSTCQLVKLERAVIAWLVQTTGAHAGLAEGIPPPGLLSPAERERFASLRTAKRRRDWLLGRWTAKRLLQDSFVGRDGEPLPLDAFTVASAADGAPELILDFGLPILDWARGSPEPNPKSKIGYPAGVNLKCISLSISHSNDRALCAVAPGAAAGCDIERIEPRPPLFAQDYFTAAELELLEGAPPALRDTLVAAIWSAKEATLKALRLGLTVDTRAVTCVLHPPPHPPAPSPTGGEEGVISPSPQTAEGGIISPSPPVGDKRSAVGGLVGGWGGVEITPHGALLGCKAPALRGWWRVEDGYVLTLAATVTR